MKSPSNLYNEKKINCPDFAKIIKESNPDISLFDQVAACFSNRLQKFAGYYCKNEALGMDAFQEAMLTAFLNFSSFRGDSPIEPWLRKIVISSCSRLKRGKINQPTSNLTLFPDKDYDDKNQHPEQEWAVMMAQSLEILWAQIDQLKEPSKSLFIDHDIKEEPISQLIIKYQLSQDSIKSHLKRARATLKTNLEAKIETSL